MGEDRCKACLAGGSLEGSHVTVAQLGRLPSALVLDEDLEAVAPHPRTGGEGALESAGYRHVGSEGRCGPGHASLRCVRGRVFVSRGAAIGYSGRPERLAHRRRQARKSVGRA